jgi:5-formyltetrahydrofolate cyclo-ligase
VGAVNSTELKRAKREVRRRALASRDAMPAPERTRAGALVVERFLALPEVRAADTVMGFWSFGSEVPMTPLLDRLHARGVTIALPRVVRGELEATVYRPGDRVTETSFGAFEPGCGNVLEPRAIDVIATPAVAFDRDGHRVGYGGGFYDRFLPRTRTDAARIGIGYALQLEPPGTSLPAGPFDALVDVVVTENEVVRCRRAA